MTTTHPQPSAGMSQCQRILARLQETPGQWVSMPELSRVSGALPVHSRIVDLREDGWRIGKPKIERDGRICKSFYRLDVCHFCGIPLHEKDTTLNEHVDTGPDGETAPICDGCWSEKSHEQAKAWCLANLRPIARPDLDCDRCSNNQSPVPPTAEFPEHSP